LLVRSRWTGTLGRAHRWTGSVRGLANDVLGSRECWPIDQHPCAWGEWVVRVGDGPLKRYPGWLFNLIWKEQ